MHIIIIIIISHRTTMYIYVAYCYRPSNVVCRPVCYSSQSCKNGRTDRAIWVEGLGEPKESCIRRGTGPPWEGAILMGKRGGPL